MASLAPTPANRHGKTGHLAHPANGYGTANGYGGYGAVTPTTTITDPNGGPSPLRQGTVARHEAWVDRQYASSYPARGAAQAQAYTPGRYLGPPSAPFGAFGAPSPATVPLAPDERAQLLVLREFYEIVTGPEKDGERARRLRGIAGAAGLPLEAHPLAASQPRLDSDALLHRWLRWVRYCRQEAGDVEPFFHLMRSTLYGDAFWAAREEGERVCARALSWLYERDGSPGQRPDPRARPWSYSDRTVLQTAATLLGVRWAVASLEYQQETQRTLARAAAHGTLRPALVALLIPPTIPSGPQRAGPPQPSTLLGMSSGAPLGTQGGTPAPLEGPCIVIRTTEAAYAAQVNWDFACMLGYLTLLRPFFVGTGHPGDYRELPSPRADTSITPHLHQFALALTSEEGCPNELGCECRRVAWTLNLPPPQHPRATDELDGRAVAGHEAAQGLRMRPADVGAAGGGGAASRAFSPSDAHREHPEGRVPGGVMSGPPRPAMPSGGPLAPAGGAFDGVPFADWPPDEDGCGEDGCGEDGDEGPAVGAVRPVLTMLPPPVLPLPPQRPAPAATGGVPPHTPHTVIEVWRAQAEAQQAARQTASQPARAGGDAGGVDPAAPWSGNAADLVDTDLKVALLDTGEAATAGSAASDPPAPAAAPTAALHEMPTDERRYVTPVLPVLRPHRSGSKGKKAAPARDELAAQQPQSEGE